MNPNFAASLPQATGADALGADGAEEEQGRQGGETDANGHATAGEAARR